MGEELPCAYVILPLPRARLLAAKLTKEVEIYDAIAPILEMPTEAVGEVEAMRDAVTEAVERADG
jgi:hypothetical protein